MIYRPRPVLLDASDRMAHGGLSIQQLLPGEIVRLKTELSALIRRRRELTAAIDLEIAELRQRIAAAEGMLAAYNSAPLGDAAPAKVRRIPRRAGSRQRARVDWTGGKGTPVALTWEEVEATDIPPIVGGRSLHSNAKRAQIIRATKAYLAAVGRGAGRTEILGFLNQLEIMGDVRRPAAYLSVILSNAKEVFVTNGVAWQLRSLEHLQSEST